MNPNLFWSASEDGTVRQFDKRCRCRVLTHQRTLNAIHGLTGRLPDGGFSGAVSAAGA